MGRWRFGALLLTAIAASACGAAHTSPTLPAPIPKAPEAPFALKVASFVFAGGAVWVECYVPESMGAGAIRFGVEQIRISTEEIWRSQNRLLVERIGCEGSPWTASCTVLTYADRKQHRLTREIQVSGCGEAGDRGRVQD